MWCKKINDFHDEEVFGIEYNDEQHKLFLKITNHNILEFNNVIFFEQKNFSMHNVIFDIHEYNSKELPAFLLEQFPVLNFFQEKNETYDVLYIDPSTGLEMVIVIENHKYIDIEL